MTRQLAADAGNRRQDERLSQDLTGRDRMISNVLFNWGAHFVFIVAGFVLPRMIDRQLGQELLGVWDYAWSLVVYTEFLAVGVSTSVDRYVSRFRSLRDWENLNLTVSSSLVLLIISFCAGLLLAIGFAQLTPYLLKIGDENLLSQAQLIVTILGITCAVQLPMLAFTGVITGSGRFDIDSAIRGGSRLLEVGAMVLLLMSGYGLIAMATTMLSFQCLRMVGSAVGAKYVCPQLRLSFRHCSLATMRQVLCFGSKSFLYVSSRMAMYQFNAILIAHFLGPAMLAVFSRQRSLVLHCESIVLHYGRALLPVASGIHANNDREGIQDLLIRGSLFNFYIVLPLTIVLVIMGGPLVRFWMGIPYESSIVLGTLAVGHLLILSQRGTLNVLMALDRHGLAGIGMLVSLVISVLLGWFLIGHMGMGLIAAAVAVTLPTTFCAGLGTMCIGCHAIGVPVREYLRKTLLGPTILMIPFAAWLVLSRWVCGENALAALAGGLMPASIVLLVLYWRFVLPSSLKHRMTKSFAAFPVRRP